MVDHQVAVFTLSRVNPTPHPAQPLISFVYWRKNPFIAAMMDPLVLTLAQGRVLAMGPDGTPVFDAPANSIKGSLGKMGTLKITVNGKKFAIVGRGSIGQTEKGFAPPQQAFAHDFLQRFPQSSMLSHVPGVVAFSVGAGAKLGVWRDVLNANGASIS